MRVPLGAHEPVAFDVHPRRVVERARHEAGTLVAGHGGGANASERPHGRSGAVRGHRDGDGAGGTHATRVLDAARAAREPCAEEGSGERLARIAIEDLGEPGEHVIGQDIGPRRRVRELHVAAQDAVPRLGAAQHGGVRRMGAAEGMNEEERREEHHRERVEVRLARERAGERREVDAVEARIEEPLVRDDAREGCKLHGVGVDEPGLPGRGGRARAASARRCRR